MRRVIKFVLYFFRNCFSKRYRYIRLTPFIKGYICFFDKFKFKIITVHSRGKSDSITADEIYTHQEYDFSLIARYREIKELYDEILVGNHIPVIVDCGANIGLSARYFSEKFPDASVIAIEPDIENYKAMIKNCINFKNVNCRNLAVGSSNGFCLVDRSPVDNRAFKTYLLPAGVTEGVGITTINEIYNEDKNFRPFIVKIDIEGFEQELFSKNTQWYSITPLVIIETHDWMFPKKANAKNFLAVASSENRDFLHRGENIWSISNCL